MIRYNAPGAGPRKRSRDPLPIKEILGKVIENLSGASAGARRPGEEEIIKLWAGAAGSAASRQSRPVSLRKGRLVVAVNNSSFLYELTLRKSQILGYLQSNLQQYKIQDIQFRIGDTGGEENPKTGTKKRKRNNPENH